MSTPGKMVWREQSEGARKKDMGISDFRFQITDFGMQIAKRKLQIAKRKVVGDFLTGGLFP
jgi:hypothetical protein